MSWLTTLKLHYDQYTNTIYTFTVYICHRHKPLKCIWSSDELQWRSHNESKRQSVTLLPRGILQSTADSNYIQFRLSQPALISASSNNSKNYKFTFLEPSKILWKLSQNDNPTFPRFNRTRPWTWVMNELNDCYKEITRVWVWVWTLNSRLCLFRMMKWIILKLSSSRRLIVHYSFCIPLQFLY